MKVFLRIFAIFLLLLLGFSGIYGGWMLISDPTGAKFEWTTELLDGTPFNNFLIPGITLFIVNGLLPLSITIFTILKVKKYEWLIISQGFLLIGWLTAELLFNRDLFVPELHYPFYDIGILMVLSGFFLLRIHRFNLRKYV